MIILKIIIVLCLVWAAENKDHMHGVCIPNRVLAYRNSKGEGKRRNGGKNNNKIEIENIEKRFVGTKEKSPKQGQISAKV